MRRWRDMSALVGTDLHSHPSRRDATYAARGRSIIARSSFNF